MRLSICGYLNRVRSSRRLEAECHRNIEVICSPDLNPIEMAFAKLKAHLRARAIRKCMKP